MECVCNCAKTEPHLESVNPLNHKQDLLLPSQQIPIWLTESFGPMNHFKIITMTIVSTPWLILVVTKTQPTFIDSANRCLIFFFFLLNPFKSNIEICSFVVHLIGVWVSRSFHECTSRWSVHIVYSDLNPCIFSVLNMTASLSFSDSVFDSGNHLDQNSDSLLCLPTMESINIESISDLKKIHCSYSEKSFFCQDRHSFQVIAVLLLRSVNLSMNQWIFFHSLKTRIHSSASVPPVSSVNPAQVHEV